MAMLSLESCTVSGACDCMVSVLPATIRGAAAATVRASEVTVRGADISRFMFDLVFFERWAHSGYILGGKVAGLVQREAVAHFERKHAIGGN